MKEDAQEAKPKMRKAEDTLGHFECISKILSSQAIFDRVQLSLCNISSYTTIFQRDASVSFNVLHSPPFNRAERRRR